MGRKENISKHPANSNNDLKNLSDNRNSTSKNSSGINYNTSKNSSDMKNNTSRNSSGMNTSKSKSQLYNNKNNKNVNIRKPNIVNLFPVLFIIAILPLIVHLTTFSTSLTKYPWFSDTSIYFDFFLYYKQLFFIIISAVMVIIIAIRASQNNKLLKFTPIFVPLAIYALLAVLSSVFSEYKIYSFTGNFEQFESLFALLGYCLVVYYVYLFVQTEQDIKFIIKGLVICAIILGLLGLSQSLGHDFFSTTFGWQLITPRKYWGVMDKFTFTFGDNWTYLTFYNPNYVGSYIAMVAPIILVLMLNLKKPKLIILYFIAFLGLIISLIGSQSASGITAIIIALLFTLIFLRRYLLKYIRIVLPVFVLSLTAVLVFNSMNGNIIGNLLNKISNIKKTNYTLTDIQTNDDQVIIKYSGNIMKIRFFTDAFGLCNYDFTDDKDQPILSEYSTTQNGSCTIKDDRFPGFVLYAYKSEDKFGFCVTIDGHDWYFTNQTEDGSYYYYNQYGKLDKILTAPSALFTGYENYASNRGYIWSRTIPLLKNNLLLGSGADTFSLEFPQSDYVGYYNFGFGNELVTKPHNMYLQIGVQTGVVSLLAFLIFYGIYFISSIKLYIKGRFSSYYSQIGIGILIGSFSYMICGISNDSSITIAPVFWVLIGIGIVANKKARPLIKEEALLAKDKIETIKK